VRRMPSRFHLLTEVFPRSFKLPPSLFYLLNIAPNLTYVYTIRLLSVQSVVGSRRSCRCRERNTQDEVYRFNTRSVSSHLYSMVCLSCLVHPMIRRLSSQSIFAQHTSTPATLAPEDIKVPDHANQHRIPKPMTGYTRFDLSSPCAPSSHCTLQISDRPVPLESLET
jgi:hypothetical protein